MANKLPHLIQRVLQSSKVAIAEPEHSPKPPSTSAYYFHLNLFPLLDPTTQAEANEPTPSKALVAGQAYRMCVTAELNPDGCTTVRSIMIYKAFEFLLESDHSHVQVESLPITVSSPSAGSAVCEFRITVAADYVGDSVTLALRYRRLGTTYNLTEISNYKLQGLDAYLDEQQPVRHIVLDRRLSANVRVLHVKPLQPNLYHIECYWDEKTEFRADIPPLGESPARFLKREKGCRDIINQIIERSSYNPKPFIQWLKNHLRDYGQDFCLIIHDDSDTADMAWELIYLYLQPKEFSRLPADLIGQVPLGALITITRWVPGMRLFEFGRELAVTESRSAGRVVALLDHGQSLEYAPLEHDALRPFSADLCDNVDDFKARLGNVANDTGLIYIGSHGRVIVDKEMEPYFTLYLNQNGEIKIYDLVSLPYHHDTIRRPIVMVNACHSAWLFRHEGRRYGLPVTLLRTIAKDFIGTIGPVGEEQAAKIAQALFSKLRSTTEGVRLPQFLRDLRADAFRRTLHSQPTEKQWSDYLFTFMYVYYGNPFSRLQVTLAAGQEGE